MWWMFGNLSVVTFTWMTMQFYAFLAYPLFSLLVNVQLSGTPLPIYIWFMGYVIYMSILVWYPVATVFKEDIPPASAFIIVAEQVFLVI